MTKIDTMESAVEAARSGKLEMWIHEFLCSAGGNRALSDGLKLETRSYHGPVEMDLDSVQRCCGPEEGMKYPVSVEEFAVRVGKIKTAIADGASLPPLIVNYSNGSLTLNDGNHRHEALKQLGFTKINAIIWTTGESDMDEFRERFERSTRKIG